MWFPFYRKRNRFREVFFLPKVTQLMGTEPGLKPRSS